MNKFTQNINFSIAESDFYFKEILVKTLLQKPFYHLVKNCNNGHELISQLFFRQENVFFIDLYMPIISGFETIKFIRQTGNKTPIITYSATYQDDMNQALTQFENIFYCQKKSMIILEILKEYVITKSKNYSEYLKEWEAKPFSVQEYLKRQEKAWYEPTLTEIQIMKLSYEGLNSKEIGQYLNLNHRSVETYILRLLKKLGLKNKIDLIRFCVEHGYYNSST